MRILFVITARGGSKGVPRKNIAVVGKYPLIAYKIISAQKCKYDKRIIVSTDDEEIADIAKKYGAEVPFIRPKELASDSANSMDVVFHAVKWIEKNDKNQYDYVCLLEPSSPFLTYQDINKAFGILEESSAKTLLGVKEVDVSRNFIFPLDSKGRLSFHYKAIKEMKSVRRQDQVKEYTLNGCIYVARWNYFVENRLFISEDSIPYIMEQDYSLEIDAIKDLDMARYMVKNGNIDDELWEFSV